MRKLSKTMTVLSGSALALSMILVAGAQVSAQEVDSGWLPFLGCWESADARGAGPLMCVRPGEERGVELVAVAEGDVVSTESLVADGQPREVSRDGCEGWQSARFSDDGRRVFLHSDVVCQDDLEQVTTGILAMPSPGEWLDVRSVEMGGESSAWVQRFRPADERMSELPGMEEAIQDLAWSVRTSRVSASAALSVDDVLEAAAEVDGEAVRAWVVENGDGFDLMAADVLQLSDAGLSDDVIDLMVAMSYPEEFIVDQQPEQGYSTSGRYMGTSGYYDPFYSPYFDPFYYGYSRYGYSRYGYSPYGLGYGLNGRFGYWGYRPTIVVVDRVGSSDGNGGYFVPGRGYTRNSGASSVPRSTPTRSTPRAQGMAPRGSTGTAAGSTGSTGRRAKPRGSGGGGGGF